MVQINSVSFKGYVPVKIYAKNPANGEYSRVIKHKNLRKCQGFVVRNLNGTAKSNKDEGFINFYKSYDKDYKACPVVMSMYDEENRREPLIYMITGSDVDRAKQLARPVGIAKSESINKLGNSKSFEARYEANNYFYNMKQFLKNTCKRLKNDKNEDLTLRVFFNPEYTKREHKLKGFKFVGCDFISENA